MPLFYSILFSIEIEKEGKGGRKGRMTELGRYKCKSSLAPLLFSSLLFSPSLLSPPYFETPWLESMAALPSIVPLPSKLSALDYAPHSVNLYPCPRLPLF